MHKYFLCSVFLFGSVVAGAQPTTGEEWKKSFDARRELAASSILKNYPVRNIGPTVQGGRIVDIDVNIKRPSEFYIGYASGGIFKTVNNGSTFEPIFDNVDAIGIGDFALSQSDPNILYVGTGEKNSSRSSYAGSGMYKTTDGGKTWSHIGLTDSHHIGRVIIHPNDNNIVWVGSMGALYTNNNARGVYKTTDGGKTWNKTLYVNDSTGIIDLVINPKNPNQLFASAWERSRKSWQFKGNGASTGIYRSDDGGNTWKRIEGGLPKGTDVGRIGLKMSAAKPERIYAVIDNQQSAGEEKKEDEPGKLKLEQLKTMSKEEFAKLEDKKVEDLLKENNFPKKYTAAIVKKDVREGRYTPKDIADYFGGDANANLFRTKIKGAEVYRSDDGGNSWKRTHQPDLDGVFFTYGYYFAEMEVAPDNADVLYIYGVPLLKSKDAGATWHRIDTLEGVRDIHVDHHVVWANPNDSKHLILGNDGGLYVSYDEGANWNHINNMPVGQFYTVNVDMETPYNVYGGLQDNGVLKGSSRSVPNQTKHWERLFGGDGMYVSPDPRNSKTVFAGFQFGNYYKLGGQPTKITPTHDIGEASLRWNWRAPLFLSKHNPDIVYMASHRVHRSFNQGETWEVISPDLTKNRNTGNVPFSTIASLKESPLKFGLLYAGTDDGNVWVSKNSGGDWVSISNGLPADKWVSSITPSSHQEGTLYVTLNGYRDDDFKTYVYESTDYGKTWKSIKGNLPESVANVLIQDPVNPDLLYCGLDNGTYVSLDKGSRWHFMNGMLNVPAYDMMVHPRDNELVVGTHGRSVYVADVKPLQALRDGGVNKGVLAFEPESIRHNPSWGKAEYAWEKASEPKIEMMYYVGAAAQSVTIEIYDDKNNLVRRLSGSGAAGFNKVRWDGKVDAPAVDKKNKGAKQSPTPSGKYAAKGKYKIRFINGAATSEVNFEIK